MKRTLKFIVNPFSGTSSKRNLESLVDAHLNKDKFDYSFIYTEKAKHAIKLSKQCVEEKTDIVVAVGGDGSVNEVASQLIHTDTMLGIIPSGSGNGFARHLGIPIDPIAAIKCLNTASPISVDTCKVNDKAFVNVAGIGFDAKIAYLTKKNKKRGFLPYFITSVKESKNFRPSILKITIDGKVIEGKYAAAVVANASMYGYKFAVAPSASLQDGILDITLIKEAPVYKYFLHAHRFLNRTLHLSSLVDTYTGKSISIELQENEFVHVDGEGFRADEKLTFTLHEKSLNVLVPAERILPFAI